MPSAAASGDHPWAGALPARRPVVPKAAALPRTDTHAGAARGFCTALTLPAGRHADLIVTEPRIGHQDGTLARVRALR
jgi:hypothetical protein